MPIRPVKNAHLTYKKCPSDLRRMPIRPTKNAQRTNKKCPTDQRKMPNRHTKMPIRPTLETRGRHKDIMRTSIPNKQNTGFQRD